MASESGITSKRPLAPGSLVVAPELEALFPTNEVAPLLSERIAVDGFDPHRPIDAWKDGAGRGRHVVLEGHTRLQAAKDAGVDRIPVVLRSFSSAEEALLWAADQQAHRRNLGREAMAVSIIRALARRRAHRAHSAQEMADRYGVSKPTIDRARALVERGRELDIAAVLDGQVGLKDALGRVDARLKRDAADELVDAPPAPADVAPGAEVEDEPDPAIEPAPEELLQARDVLHSVRGRVERLEDILLAASARDVLDDIRDGRIAAALDELDGLLADLRTAVGALP